MKTFVAADHHMFHGNAVNFTDRSGVKTRPWDTVEQMSEDIITRHNAVVRPTDMVYFLGDVLFNRKIDPSVLNRFNGKKILVLGNHDNLDAREYLEVFQRVTAYASVYNILLSHMPVHESCKRHYIGNVHGHLHEEFIKDPWYRCVSMEQINFTPIDIEIILKDFTKSKESAFTLEHIDAQD